jgi:hypothetical protein
MNPFLPLIGFFVFLGAGQRRPQRSCGGARPDRQERGDPGSERCSQDPLARAGSCSDRISRTFRCSTRGRCRSAPPLGAAALGGEVKPVLEVMDREPGGAAGAALRRS